MPFGGTSPEQDKKIDSCISQISGVNPRTKKPFTKSEKVAICKSRVMGKSLVFSDFVSVKAEGEEFFIEGVISSTSPDLGNDVVTENALNQMAAAINDASEGGRPLPVGYEHSEILGGHPNLVPIGSFVQAWVDNGKLFAKASLNKALTIFDEVKSALDRKDLHSFSIEYIPGDDTSDSFIDGVKHRIINTMKAIVGVAVTGRPMNPEAVMSFAAKNLDFASLEVKNDESVVEEMEEEKKDDAPEAPVEEKKEEVTEAKTVEVKAQPEQVETKSEFTVSADRYQKLQEVEMKAAEEQKQAEFKSMFDKYYADLSKQQVQSNAPQMDAQKFGGKDMPAELKAWNEAIDSGDSRQMFAAGGKLLSLYESKGMQYGVMPRSVSHTFMQEQSVRGREGMELNQSTGGKFQLKTVELKAQVEHDTDRTTSGTEYYLSGPLLNDIFAPAIITHLNESHTTYSLMRKEDASDFGDTYGFRFKYARSGSATNYDESATDNPTAQATSRKKAHIPFMWYRTIGQVSGPTQQSARGRGGVGDAFALEVRDQTEELLNKLNVDIFDSTSPSDGMTRGGQILSLRYLVDDSTTHTTLYGHTRTSGNFTTLQGVLTAKSGSPNPIKNDLRLMWTTSVENGADKGDLVYVTSYAQMRRIMNLLDDAQRFNGEIPHAGFVGMPTFDGIPIHADQDCDDGFIYLLDLRHTFLSVQLAPTMEELAKTGDFRKFHIKTYWALVGTAPNHNYLMTGFNTA